MQGLADAGRAVLEGRPKPKIAGLTGCSTKPNDMNKLLDEARHNPRVKVALWHGGHVA